MIIKIAGSAETVQNPKNPTDSELQQDRMSRSYDRRVGERRFYFHPLHIFPETFCFRARPMHLSVYCTLRYVSNTCDKTFP